VGELRRSIADGELYLNISADTQHLGLPGARLVTTTSSLVDSDRRGSSTPFDFADKQGANIALGGTRMIGERIELVVDAGVRHKAQQSKFFNAFGNSYADTALTTFSITPRANIAHDLFGLAGKAIAGVDLYRSFYGSDRKVDETDRPSHRYELGQRMLALYAQDTLSIRPDTDLSLGLRVQNVAVTADDAFDATAPSSGSNLQGRPLDSSETQHAFHLGLEHRVSPVTTVFGRAGRSFRMPNVDERVGSAPFGTQVDFALKTQTSMDAEIGFRRRWGGFGLQVSGFAMELRDEIHYDPTSFINTNLDPTRRMGVEGAANWSVTDALRLRSSLAYTDARFREGKWRGNEVPLVSRVTGSAGVSWDIAGKLATLDAGVRRVGDRRFDSDQANFQPMIPGHTLVDLRLGGEAGMAFWSVAAMNLLDQKYFDYGAASTSTYGRYNAYPLPGRTFMARVGARF
jgi:iron complex outermembrane receptor protein